MLVNLGVETMSFRHQWILSRIHVFNELETAQRVPYHVTEQRIVLSLHSVHRDDV